MSILEGIRTLLSFIQIDFAWRSPSIKRALRGVHKLQAPKIDRGALLASDWCEYVVNNFAEFKDLES